jgi:DNA-binding CsgD family transcriptional regulator
MAPCSIVANEAFMTARGDFRLREHEQDRLLRAIESALEVDDEERFHAWLRGPLRMLLPHESVMCIELDRQGGVRQLLCLHHILLDAGTTEHRGDPDVGLAARLVARHGGNRRQTCLIDGEALRDLPHPAGTPCERAPAHNAVIHRVTLLSGSTFHIVLINVAADQAGRCRHLFKLLSSHLKMALSRSIAAPPSQTTPPLTERELEILRWMSAGKSNREISALLDISAITLKNHVSKIYRKLDVQNRADAVAKLSRLCVAPGVGTV